MSMRGKVIELSQILLEETKRKRAICLLYELQNGLLDLTRQKEGQRDILDCDRVLNSKVSLSREYYRGNSFYGIGSALREYAKADRPLRACIEHGVYFGDYVNSLETEKSGFPFVVTFSKTRVQHIAQKSTIPAIPIGPYIMYASPVLTSQEYEYYKSMLGRTLLVFPSHSTEGIKVKYDYEPFRNYIYSLVKEYDIDSVLVCIYYKDITKDVLEYYTNCGFIPVTCGRREDSLFLRRQRSLIELSDITTSNAVGTHIGYCAALDKPHAIYIQQRELSINPNFNEHINTTSSYEYETSRVIDAFSTLSITFTQKQIDVCSDYWGLGIHLTPAQLSSVFEIADETSRCNQHDGRTRARELLVSDKSLSILTTMSWQGE